MQELLTRVWQAIDSDRLLRTLLEMIDIYSPSGKEEDIQLYIEERLTAAGLPVTRQVVDGERYNLCAVMGSAPPRLSLVGHVDTVPAWDLDEYAAAHEWGVVRGLGAADMKGGCAAMLEAWLALAGLPVEMQPPVGLLFVVGEEENGDGSERFLAESQPPLVVIGEPTALAPCLSHYGYLEVALTTQGRRIHSSLPELGHNAIESMLRFLLLLGREAALSPENGQVVYSIREMSSSRAGFVVPDQCETCIDLHLAPHVTPDAIKQILQDARVAALGTIAGLNLEMSFDFASQGYDLRGVHPQIETVLGDVYQTLNLPLQFEPFRSHSDGNLFHAAGCHAMILGPGSLETAHTADEQTTFAEVESAARIYAALCLAVPPR
ncbi:MAG: M20/M25/M40 family metallo-hydrolase [Desulfuromonadales bacterium]|nr:M20/M25/M40 family metallo-hydrolase [Desulfuromonadales bacterium]